MGCGGSKSQKDLRKEQDGKNDRKTTTTKNKGQEFHEAGAPASNEPRLTHEKAGLIAFEAMTNFNETEIQILRKKFDEIASLRAYDNGTIYEDEFMKALLGEKHGEPPLLYKRLFDKFDMGKTGHIDFQDFVNGLSPFSKRASDEEKIKFSFSLLDLARNDVITRHEVRTILDSSLKKVDLQFTPEQINDIIDQTFEQAADDGAEASPVQSDVITFPQYEKLCKRHPMMLSMFTLSHLDELLTESQEDVSGSAQS